jgi:HD superfamily phosphohydrolase
MPIKFVSSIRDPVYGTIPITECEQDVLRLPILNRLRGIKQLGLAYLAFPGANHTRFEHSLGTMHVAYLMCQSLDIEDHITQLIRLAALLHDVGHAPFSHTLELAFNMFRNEFKEIPPEDLSHESWTSRRITKDKDLAKTIKNHLGVVHIKDIAKFAVGNYGDRTFDSVLKSPIDADKTDYILRDNLHCGFPVALDITTISEILDKDKEFGFIVKSEGISFVEQLLIGRYHLITKIHHNRKNRLGNYLMALGLRDAICSIKRDELIGEVHRIFEMNDYELYSFLKERMGEKFKPLNDFFMGKETLTELCNFDYSILTPMARLNASVISARKHLLPEISKQLQVKVKSSDIYVDINQAKLPDLDLWIFDPSGQKIPIIETPMVQGIVKTSLSWLQLALYSFQKNGIALDTKEIRKLYRELDEKIDEKFDYNLRNFENDEKTYGLFLLIDLLMNKATKSLHKTEIPGEDMLIVVFKAIYDVLTNEFKESHLFIDGASNFVELVDIVQKDDAIFSPLQKKRLMLKKYNLKDTAIGKLPSEIFVDIEKLVNFGMLYRKEEVVKYKKFYNKKQQIRLSGWGRNYHEKNLEKNKEIVGLCNRVYKHLADYVKDDKDAILEYIGTSEVPKDDKMRKKREKIRAKTYFRITR